MNTFKTALIGAGLAASLPAMAATDLTTTFQARIVILNACIALSASDLDFGSRGVLSANIDQTSTINITCTSGAPYTVKLNAGANAGTTNDVNTRRMKSSATNYVSYNLYSDSAGGTTWDNTTGVTRSGTGSVENITVYGRVPPQTTPPADTYTDTVTVTLTY
ncbi:Csu type fimbrial protein [Solimonas terrae]|uniref:Spore coat U domain-containing protein n=1 Tax=Solimonas terrae TaxID=1396819 RepID=A0A6M2BQT4_9GAMM|nr:spore coat U domain-containing protein [Solimonas terrae]NGY04417.1 spore coat U domain-containing protein [Solimonas terrae]